MDEDMTGAACDYRCTACGEHCGSPTASLICDCPCHEKD